MGWRDKMWKNIKCNKIAGIEKLVGEYNIWELYKTPYGKFKIKIYVDSSGRYRGYTNLQVLDEAGDFCCGVGGGNTEEMALEDTLNNFLEMLSRKEVWEEEDFQCSDSYDF